MVMIRVGILVAVIAASTGVWAQPDSADKERARLQSLARHLAVVETDNPACPPFDAVAKFRVGEGAYQATVRFRRPERLEVVLQDSADGTPCAVSSPEGVLVFDPAAPRLVRAPGFRAKLLFGGTEDGKANFDTGLGFGNDHPQRVMLDVPSLFLKGPGELTDLGSEAGLIRLRILRSEGKRIEVEQTTREELPVCRIRMFDAEAVEPECEVTLTLHGRDDRPLFHAAGPDQLAQLLPVTNSSPGAEQFNSITGFAAAMQTLGQVFYGVHAHLGLKAEDLRDKCPIPGFAPPDWNAVARHRALHSRRLRELLELPEVTLDDDRPLMPQMAAEEVERVLR